MLEIYIASIVLYGLLWGWMGKLKVDEGGEISFGELFWTAAFGFVPIVQQFGIGLGVLLLFGHYEDKTIFGGKK